ncbi:phosphoribosylanthranilate isomerase [Vacuolonema iberomarrocanum]|uniref:phosphoribosylanthranilate isomerase n=1 Tax=Vacuolonema iberomarrocanum TaxID=3454632 RepID=UPI001A053508|nr:phosphoribosylanthranilate isomerase [filamentous cyanobacterium LEGE 07170]
MQVKICGITRAEQGQAIARMGATALGFICVARSPRYITAEAIRAIVPHLPEAVERVGVFVNATPAELVQWVKVSGLTAVQLHGDESPQTCRDLREALPGIKLIKAFRVKHPNVLAQTDAYTAWVDALLLDAYHPTQQGGTGQTLDWETLQSFRPAVPWFLAGGLTPANVREAIALTHPDGIDLSSGVEQAPGIKDLQKVEHLFAQLQTIMPTPLP